MPPIKPAPAGALNVLSIMVDDLRPQLGCYNITVCGAKMFTPNMAVAGLPPPQTACPGCNEGDSAAPLFTQLHQPWKKAAFSQYARCSRNNITGYYVRCSGAARDDPAVFQAMGYSVRTLQWRYVEWCAQTK